MRLPQDDDTPPTSPKPSAPAAAAAAAPAPAANSPAPQQQPLPAPPQSLAEAEKPKSMRAKQMEALQKKRHEQQTIDALAKEGIELPKNTANRYALSPQIIYPEKKKKKKQ